MTDVLFSFGDEFFYSNNLANWNEITQGQEISIINNNEKFFVVRNDIITYNKPFKIKDEKTLEINSQLKDLVFDGDTIDCVFKPYSIVAVNDILERGSGYENNEIVTIKNESFFDHKNDRKVDAVFKINKVDENGGIMEISLLENGKYVESFTECEIEGGKGKGAKINVMINKLNEKIMTFFSVLDVKHNDNSILVEVDEKIKNKFSSGEILIKRHRITVNKPLVKNYVSQPFFVRVEKTPFLNLPLAKDNNIEQLYNQAILTIDSKMEQILRPVK